MEPVESEYGYVIRVTYLQETRKKIIENTLESICNRESFFYTYSDGSEATVYEMFFWFKEEEKETALIYLNKLHATASLFLNYSLSKSARFFSLP